MKAVRFLFVLLLLVVGATYFFVYAPFGQSSETFVDIPSGTGTAGMATRLQQAGIIRSKYAFEIFRQYKGGTLHAGEYRFDHPAALPEVYARIARGDVYTRTLTIPEGFNIFDIAAAVERAGLGSAPSFLAAERRNTALVADLSPGATSLEGFLFPDTYRFSPHATPDQMLAAMVKRFREQATRIGLLAPAGAVGDDSLYDVARTVTMASLVEKEVHLDAERPLVAGVFNNRLAASMPLATDPAIIYAALLANRWRGTIFQSDLSFDSPYNTYKHTGLPPGPIANPGVAALRAAMQPVKTSFLYFVADAGGRTQFSATLEEHARQVRQYRQSQKP